MPSPVGHALGGIAAGWSWAPHKDRAAVVALAVLGASADFDLLINDHRGPAHSLGAAILVGILVAVWTRRLRWGAAACAAWASHVVLDWLGTDTRPPIGIMVLWPLTHGYFESPFHVFPAISRRYWLSEFWVYNLKAVAVELAVLLPISVAIRGRQTKDRRRKTEGRGERSEVRSQKKKED